MSEAEQIVGEWWQPGGEPNRFPGVALINGDRLTLKVTGQAAFPEDAPEILGLSPAHGHITLLQARRRGTLTRVEPRVVESEFVALIGVLGAHPDQDGRLQFFEIEVDFSGILGWVFPTHHLRQTFSEDGTEVHIPNLSDSGY